MTNRLYDNCFVYYYKSNVKEVVSSEEGYWHTFEDTIFYVEGGGMKGDEGYINKYKVLALKKEHDRVWHLLEVALEGSVEMSVSAHVRFTNAQIHTAQHVISGILKNIYGYETLSHHVQDYMNDIDFDTNEITQTQLHDLQVVVNGLIRDDISVKISYPSQIDIKKLGYQSCYGQSMRLVEIGKLTQEPCGCIHVPSLRYLQMIKILGVEKCSRGTRLKYVVGDQLLRNYADYYTILQKCSNTLAQPFEFIDYAINKQKQESKSLQADIVAMRAHIARLYLEGLDTSKAVCKFFDDIDLQTLKVFTTLYIQQHQQAYCFILNYADKVYVMFGNAKDSESIMQCLKQNFQLQGGGKEHLQFGGKYVKGMENHIFLHFQK